MGKHDFQQGNIEAGQEYMMRTGFFRGMAVLVLCSSVMLSADAARAQGNGVARDSGKDQQRALEISQKHLQKARTLKEKGKSEAAIAEYRKSVEACSATVVAYLELGELYAQTGAHAKAVEMLDIGISMALLQEIVDPDIGRSCCILAKSHQALGRSDLASGALVKAMKYLTDDPLPYVVLGDIQTERRKYDEAFGAYRRALAMDATNADGWWAFGTSALRAKRPEVAREAHQGLLQADPDRALRFAEEMTMAIPSGTGL